MSKSSDRRQEEQRKANQENVGALPNEAEETRQEVQTVDKDAVIDTAAREQSIEGHAPDITSVEDRQQTDETPRPREEKKGKYTNPLKGIVRGVAEFHPGRHPKDRQIADKLANEEGSSNVNKTIEVVDSNS